MILNTVSYKYQAFSHSLKKPSVNLELIRKFSNKVNRNAKQNQRNIGKLDEDLGMAIFVEKNAKT